MDAAAWVIVVIYFTVGASFATIDMVSHQSIDKSMTFDRMVGALVHYFSYLCFWPIHLYLEIASP